MGRSLHSSDNAPSMKWRCSPGRRLPPFGKVLADACLRGLQPKGRQALVSTWQARDGTTRPQLDLVADEVASTTPRPMRPKAQAGSASAGDPFGDLPGAGDVDWLGA